MYFVVLAILLKDFETTGLSGPALLLDYWHCCDKSACSVKYAAVLQKRLLIEKNIATVITRFSYDCIKIIYVLIFCVDLIRKTFVNSANLSNTGLSARFFLCDNLFDYYY
jgi:hypothetical protein